MQEQQIQKTEQAQVGMELDARLDNIAVLHTLLSGTSSLTQEAILIFTPQSVSISEMSTDGIAMVKANLESRCFSRYVLPKPINIGVKVADLVKMIPKKDASVGLEVANDKLRLTITKKDNTTEKLEVPLVELTAREEKEPMITPTAVWDMDSTTLKEYIKKAGQVSEYLCLTTSQVALQFSAEGDAGIFSTSLPRDNPILSKYSVVGRDEVMATYNATILHKIVSAGDKNSRIQVCYRTGDPIRIEYQTNGVAFRYYLAPYMESNKNEAEAEEGE